MYQEESFIDCIEEMKALVDAHGEEVSLHKDTIKFDPDYDTYVAASGLDILKVVTARTHEDEMIGYSTYFIQPHPHYKGTMFASNDALFVRKDYRNSSVGYCILEKAEEMCKELGVQVMTINSKVNLDFKPLMDRLGFNRVEYMYSKFIGDK